MALKGLKSFKRAFFTQNTVPGGHFHPKSSSTPKIDPKIEFDPFLKDPRGPLKRTPGVL